MTSDLSGYNPGGTNAEGIMALPRRRASDDEQVGTAGAPGSGADWRDLYEIENPDEVAAYVREHPVLVPMLVRASAEIASRFGPATDLLLEYVVDPDDDPPSDYLSLGIVSDLDAAEAYARRARLDDEWWIDAIRDVAGLLTIDVTHR